MLLTTQQHSMTAHIREGQPCEDDSIDEAAYRREFIAAVEEALAEVERGEVVSFEEIKKEFCSCAI